MLRDCLFLSGESGFTMKVAFSRDRWWHSGVASSLVLSNGKKYVKRKTHPLEELRAVIYYADMDDKKQSLENLMTLARSSTLCWPSPLALINAHDRFLTLGWLKNLKNINHPIWLGTWENRAESMWEVNTYPFVVKVGNQHRGQGKFLVKNWDEWVSFPQWEGLASVEPYFEGRSVRALKVGKKIWGIETKNENSWIKNSLGAEQEICQLTSELRQDAEANAACFCLDIAGIDYIVDNDGKFHLLEVNQFPGLGGYSEFIDAYAKQYLLSVMDNMTKKL